MTALVETLFSLESSKTLDDEFTSLIKNKTH